MDSYLIASTLNKEREREKQNYNKNSLSEKSKN